MEREKPGKLNVMCIDGLGERAGTTQRKITQSAE